MTLDSAFISLLRTYLIQFTISTMYKKNKDLPFFFHVAYISFFISRSCSWENLKEHCKRPWQSLLASFDINEYFYEP